MTSDLSPSEWRTRAARQIADELRGRPPGRGFAKVSSLLHAFSSPRVHTDIGDLLEALEGEGLQLLSPREHISRRDAVEVVLEGGETETLLAGSSGEASVRLTRWQQGAEPIWEAGSQWRESGLAEGELLWFDVDPSGIDPSEESVGRLLDLLQPYCPELKTVMVRDLLTADPHPKAETYGDERLGVRTVSIPALIAREVPDEDDQYDGVDEQLLTQMVELLVGPGWMVTCWHPGRILVGGGKDKVSPGLLRAPFVAHVAHRWLNDPVEEGRPGSFKDSSDLATYFARSLVATYGASLRMLQRWISDWEGEFFQSLGGIEGEQSREGKDPRDLLRGAAREISSFLSLVGEFSRNVNALQLAREEMPNKTWFVTPSGPAQVKREEDASSGQAHRLGDSVTAASHKLELLLDEIRADMDLLMIHSQAQQQESAERLQGYLGKITGLILVPTFVAGLYGANTALPGGGSWMGFEIMILLMVASAGISYFFIRRIVS